MLFNVNAESPGSPIARQLPAAPVMVLPVRIKLPNVAAVQRPHDTDAREHRRAARYRDQDQGFHRSLPLRGRVLGLRKLRAEIIAGW